MNFYNPYLGSYYYHQQNFQTNVDPINHYFQQIELRNFYDWIRENEGGYPMDSQIIFQRYREFFEKRGIFQPIQMLPTIVWTPTIAYGLYH